MNIEEAIEAIQQLQVHDCTTYERQLLNMAEGALVDLVNYSSDGPRSFNVEIMIKEFKK